MIRYRLEIPLYIKNGRPSNYVASWHDDIEGVKAELDRTLREYAKHAKVWRLTEEEIDIDKEDW